MVSRVSQCVTRSLLRTNAFDEDCEDEDDEDDDDNDDEDDDNDVVPGTKLRRCAHLAALKVDL